MLGTVILRGAAICNHCDFILGITICNSQLAENRGNAVVVFIRAFIEGISEFVRTAANNSLAASYIPGDAFTFDKIVTTNSNFMVGQRSAVILLGVRGAGQGNVTL